MLVITRRDLFPDNWIYIHDARVRMGRIQNFKNWAPRWSPTREKTCLGLEYFCFEGDDLWAQPDAALLELGKREIGQFGLADGAGVEGAVVRMPKAYPVYDRGYSHGRTTIRNGWRIPQPAVGGPQRHAPLQQPGPLDADGDAGGANIAVGDDRDPWAVNEDAEYHEISKTERQAPLMPRPTETDIDVMEDETAGEAKPAIAMVGDPTAAMSEKVMDDGIMDDTIVQDAPPVANEPALSPPRDG